MDGPPELNDWRPVAQAALAAGVARRSVYRWSQDGTVPTQRTRGRRAKPTPSPTRDGSTSALPSPNSRAGGGERLRELEDVVALLLEQVEAFWTRIEHVERVLGLR